MSTKYKNRTDEQLRKIVAAGHAARDELSARDEAFQTAANAGLVGTCQRYRNSYGGGDSWWMYRKILSVKGEWCEAFTFQTCSDGRIEIIGEKNTYLNAGEWQPISEDEFRVAWQELQNALSVWGAK